jgi:COMPASS component SWD1
VHIWQTSSPDNWAAFAPGFEELEENVEYDEREDEFDIVRRNNQPGTSIIQRLMPIQEDETDFLRRKDAEEDLIIDVLTPDDSFPRRPAPLLTLPSNIPAVNEDGVESEAAAAVRSAIDVARWAEEEPDEDEWEGFFLSLDLLVDGADEENGL